MFLAQLVEGGQQVLDEGFGDAQPRILIVAEIVWLDQFGAQRGQHGGGGLARRLPGGVRAPQEGVRGRGGGFGGGFGRAQLREFGRGYERLEETGGAVCVEEIVLEVEEGLAPGGGVVREQRLVFGVSFGTDGVEAAQHGAQRVLDHAAGPAGGTRGIRVRHGGG